MKFEVKRLDNRFHYIIEAVNEKIKHNIIVKNKLKAVDQFFKYNLSFNNADARLCAILELLKP